jgi:hypothetical protein
MALQSYHLVMVLRVAGSDTGTTPQTWTVTAETAGEAVKIARLYADRMPSEVLHSATLSDTSGAVIWSDRDERDRSARLPEGNLL